MEFLVDLLVHVVPGQAHVHVGPVGDKGDGSVKLLGGVCEGVGDSVLLVVVGEDGGVDGLLDVVGEGVGGDVGSVLLANFVLDTSFSCLITLQSA